MNVSSMIFLTTVLPALPLLAWGALLLRRARSSVDWPVVPATIMESRVLRQGSARSPRLTFSYRVEAQGRVGHRLWVGPRSVAVTGGWADGVVARYPVGANVRVAVDPRDPAYAVLEAGPRAMHWLPLAIGAVVLVAGILVAVAVPA